MATSGLDGHLTCDVHPSCITDFATVYDMRCLKCGYNWVDWSGRGIGCGRREVPRSILLAGPRLLLAKAQFSPHEGGGMCSRELLVQKFSGFLGSVQPWDSRRRGQAPLSLSELETLSARLEARPEARTC